MRANRIILFLTFFLGLIPGRNLAQFLPPDLPEQDACNALEICERSFTSYHSYRNEGLVVDLPTGGGMNFERNSVWFRMRVTTGGILAFTITPFSPIDDYDFAVFDITSGNCSNLDLDTMAGRVVRYNFNSVWGGFTGAVGMNGTAADRFVEFGSVGKPYIRDLQVQAGEVYLIMVSNAGNYLNMAQPVEGFTIDFSASTATFNQPPGPAYLAVSPYSCGYRDLVVELDRPVLCSSVAADGSDFLLLPSGSVNAAEAVSCSTGQSFTRHVKIRFDPLANGRYVLRARTGTDGNTLQSLCGTEQLLTDTIGFDVYTEPLVYRSIDSPACSVLSVRLNRPVACESIASDGSDFLVSGPAAVSVVAATGAPACVPGGRGGITDVIRLTLDQPVSRDGIYTLNARVGTDGNVLTDSCGKEQEEGDAIQFSVNSFNGLLSALPDTAICEGVTEIRLSGRNRGVAPAGGFRYSWYPESMVNDPANLNTTARIEGDSTGRFLLSTKDRNGCYLRDSVIISRLPRPVAHIRPVDGGVCIGDSLRIRGDGGDAYQWKDVSAPGNASALGCASCEQVVVRPHHNPHRYALVVTSAAGCSDTAEIDVEVYPVPVVTVTPAEKRVIYGGSVSLTAEGALSYRWSPELFLDDPAGSAPTAAPVTSPVLYTVYGFNEYGCRGITTATVHVGGFEPEFVPNAFTPNGDGKNDVFRIAGLTYQEIRGFSIYDRWGKCVFTAAAGMGEWDGNYQGVPAASGTYYYVISLSFPDGTRRDYKGDVQLIR